MVTLTVKMCTSVKDRAIGLILHSKPEPVLFYTRFGIHTFGLKFPIDVLILDKNNKIVKLSRGLKPNRIFFWNPKYNKILELPAGYTSKKKIKIGSKLNLKSS